MKFNTLSVALIATIFSANTLVAQSTATPPSSITPVRTSTTVPVATVAATPPTGPTSQPTTAPTTAPTSGSYVPGSASGDPLVWLDPDNYRSATKTARDATCGGAPKAFDNDAIIYKHEEVSHDEMVQFALTDCCTQCGTKLDKINSWDLQYSVPPNVPNTVYYYQCRDCTASNGWIKPCAKSFTPSTRMTAVVRRCQSETIQGDSVPYMCTCQDVATSGGGTFKCGACPAGCTPN